MTKERVYVGGLLLSVTAAAALVFLDKSIYAIGFFAAGAIGGASLHGILALASPDPAAVKTPGEGNRSTGEVKWFRGNKGFGFIVPDAGGEDCFVHRSSIENGNTLAQGDRVEYVLITDAKGRVAADKVIKLSA